MRRPSRPALPRLIRFMIRHFVNGLVLGAACALLALRLDVGGIGAVLARQDSALLTGLFIAYGAGLFGVFQMSVAVMNLQDDGAP
jgi:hypothetical protein